MLDGTYFTTDGASGAGGGIISDTDNNSSTNLFIAGPNVRDTTTPWFSPASGGNIFLRGGFYLDNGGPTTGGGVMTIGSPTAAQVTSAYALLRATTGDQIDTALGSGITDFQAVKVWVDGVNIAYHVVK